jgi:cyclopropane fatty-acyl-phospholipid synthase-like methyltransferase
VKTYDRVVSIDLLDAACGRDLPGFLETVDRPPVRDGIAATRPIAVPCKADPS